MRFVLSTPLKIVIDAPDVDQVRAEDATGSFGIRDGHDRFVTVLGPSVVRWQPRSGDQHFAAVDRAVLVFDRETGLRIASRRAQVSDDLHDLEQKILDEYRALLDREEKARRQARQVQLALLNRLRAYLGGGKLPPTSPFAASER